ncbi:2-amino-4-hydroxy-6-hydroxymethyldihydropteridine diphosphokinase [uncultured Prevotella sp.]|uniref:2-amino-4-hydroxy-6- hydroxymethyldihydropteridine diphosphokinase n=1 Tax=uncultured Prevotella sp. TaxID=159272 RepID=UPI00266C8775|nr:2-amino-4-hydroxy-6-hydroxymethyldihydropteridine diphosphokinase [uncultured Prevotella sp.]
MQEPNSHIVYLSLGSNLGDRHATMQSAILLLGKQAGSVDRVSSAIETEPWGFKSANKFLNMCVRITTTLSPEQLLATTKDIELQLGRTTKSVNGQYHDRPIDIDILTYDDLHINTPSLTLPHPHMHERDFVMIPLREILDK